MIEIKVTGDTPLEVLSSLTAFGCRCMKDADVAVAANHIYEAEMEKAGLLKPEQTPTEAPQAEGDPTPPPTPSKEAGKTPKASPAGTTQPKAPSDPSPAEPPEDSREAPVKAPSLEEVRSAGIEASRKYGSPAVKAILESFGVANMTGLAETDRAAFLEKLKGLGEEDA